MTHPTPEHRIRGLEASNATLRTSLRETQSEVRWAFAKGLAVGICATAALAYALPAFADTVSISGSTVTLEPAETPAIARVRFDNVNLNGSHDNGAYPLALDDVTVTVEFVWQWDLLTGADRIVVVPPAWLICEPASCGITVMEGESGAVVLLPYQGG